MYLLWLLKTEYYNGSSRVLNRLSVIFICIYMSSCPLLMCGIPVVGGEFVNVLSASDSINSLSTLSRLHACRFCSLRTRQVMSLAVRFLGNSNLSLSDMIMHPFEVRPSLRLLTLLPSLRLSTSDLDSASVFPKYFKFNTNFFAIVVVHIFLCFSTIYICYKCIFNHNLPGLISQSDNLEYGRQVHGSKSGVLYM